MKGSRLLRGAALGLACWTFAAQQPAQAAGPAKETKLDAKAPPSQKTLDVALASGGVLKGQVVNAQGVGLDGAVVSIRQGSREVAQVVADESGKFSVPNMRGGLYQVAAGQGEGLYRLWTTETAPPSAQPEAMVVSESNVVRGQTPLGMPPLPRGVMDAVAFTTLGLVIWQAFEISELDDDIDDLTIEVKSISAPRN